MTMTDETLALGTENVLPGAGPALAAGEVPLSERDRARLLRVQLRQQKDAASREAQQARFEQRQAQRRERAGQKREERRDQREDKREERADRREARSETVRAMSGWLDEHVTDLLIAPLIGMPALLGWDGMSAYGKQYWPGWLGNGLPIISEAGMWLFSIAIAIEKKKHPDAVVWPLFGAMFAFAGLCAWLNFMHGDQGPLPGSIPPGAGPGLVYAVVAVSGLFAHQVMALRGRAKVAKRKAGGKRQPRVVEIRWPWQVAKDAPAGGNGAKRPGGNPGGTVSGGRGSGSPKPGGAGPVINGAPVNGGAIANPPADDDPVRGDKKKLMRGFFDAEIREGRIPSAGAMNEAAGNKRSASLGYKNRDMWVKERAARELAEKISGKDGETAGKAGAS